MTECEYCGAVGCTLYAWRGDVWCGVCLTDLHRSDPGLPPLVGGLDDAPLGRPAAPVAGQPYVWWTPDGRVDLGQLDETVARPASVS